MKRAAALLLFLASLAVLVKLGFKPDSATTNPASSDAQADTAPAAPVDPLNTLKARYPGEVDLVSSVYDRYRNTALQIEQTDGLRGLKLLDRLDLEAVFLYENYPNDFRRLGSLMGDDAAAEILLHWREYLGLKHADESDRQVFIAEIGRLTRQQRRYAARHPEALPFILADPSGMTDLLERLDGQPERIEEALDILAFVRLDQNAADLRAALRTFEAHERLVPDSCRLMGLDGLALVKLYGPILEDLVPSIPLADALITLRINAETVDDLLRTRSPESVASLIRHVHLAGVLPEVASDPNGLRLVSEYGDAGLDAIRAAGPSAASVIYQDYNDPTLRRSVVTSLTDTGAAGLAIFAKYAEDQNFRDVVRKYGADAIPPIIQADFAPEVLEHLRRKSDRTTLETLAYGINYLSAQSGQAMIETIQNDGLDRVQQLNHSDLAFYELLPLYDILHLGNVVRRGYSPTKAELSWAFLDGCFVVMDALSLISFQPEGVAAAELARSELKAATREAAEGLGRQVVEEVTDTARRQLGRQLSEQALETSSERAVRHWLVQSAGGAFQVMKRFPEAISRLSLPELSQVARPFSQHAGLGLTVWKPLQFVRNGELIRLPVPVTVGLRHVALDTGVAGIGWVGLHKMEEHLASRRPGSWEGHAADGD